MKALQNFKAKPLNEKAAIIGGVMFLIGIVVMVTVGNIYNVRNF